MYTLTHAIAHIHGAGFAHRDLKPGFVKLFLFLICFVSFAFFFRFFFCFFFVSKNRTLKHMCFVRCALYGVTENVVFADRNHEELKVIDFGEAVKVQIDKIYEGRS